MVSHTKNIIKLQYQMNYKLFVLLTRFVITEGLSLQTMQPQSQKQDCNVLKLV